MVLEFLGAVRGLQLSMTLSFGRAPLASRRRTIYVKRWLQFGQDPHSGSPVLVLEIHAPFH